MLRRIAPLFVGAALFVLSLATSSHAEETNVHDPLPHQLRWANVDIVRGRVRITASRYNQSKTRSVVDEATGNQQHYSVSVARSKSSLRYERSLATETLVIEIPSDGSMHLKFSSLDETKLSVEYRQPSYGDVTLVIGAGNDARQWKASGFWRLGLAAPDPVRNHLTPLLECLRDGWNLSSLANRVEAELITTASSHIPVDRKVVGQLVRELGSQEFFVRQEAHDQLTSMGQSVLVALEELEYNHLDAEQRRRIAAIRRTLSVAQGDVPARTAAYLASDEAVWLAIMSHDDPKHRQLAVRQLSLIRGHAVEFDPDGERIARREQLEKLRNNTAKIK